MRRRNPKRAALYEDPGFLDLKERLAESLRRLRRENDWTQEEAAHHCGLAPRLLQRYESADANVTLSTLARLANGFGVDVRDLFDPSDDS